MNVVIAAIAAVLVMGAAEAQRRPPSYSLDDMPHTSFDCRDKILGGYYADPETDCQMFHVCVKVPGVGIQNYRFLCPNDTSFDQENQICASWYDVDCEAALLYGDNFDLYRIGHVPSSPAVRSTVAPAQLPPRNKPRPFVDEQDEYYLQRNDADQTARDVLRGSSSGNFFNNKKGREEEEEAAAVVNKKKVAVRKLRKRPQQQATPVEEEKPTSPPSSFRNTYLPRYNTINRSSPPVDDFSAKSSTAAPTYNYQSRNSYNSPSTPSPFAYQQPGNNDAQTTSVQQRNYNAQTTAAPASTYRQRNSFSAQTTARNNYDAQSTPAPENTYQQRNRYDAQTTQAPISTYQPRNSYNAQSTAAPAYTFQQRNNYNSQSTAANTYQQRNSYDAQTTPVPSSTYQQRNNYNSQSTAANTYQQRNNYDSQSTAANTYQQRNNYDAQTTPVPSNTYQQRNNYNNPSTAAPSSTYQQWNNYDTPSTAASPSPFQRNNYDAQTTPVPVSTYQPRNSYNAANTTSAPVNNYQRNNFNVQPSTYQPSSNYYDVQTNSRNSPSTVAPVTNDAYYNNLDSQQRSTSQTSRQRNGNSQRLNGNFAATTYSPSSNSGDYSNGNTYQQASRTRGTTPASTVSNSAPANEDYQKNYDNYNSQRNANSYTTSTANYYDFYQSKSSNSEDYSNYNYDNQKTNYNLGSSAQENDKTAGESLKTAPSNNYNPSNYNSFRSSSYDSKATTAVSKSYEQTQTTKTSDSPSNHEKSPGKNTYFTTASASTTSAPASASSKKADAAYDYAYYDEATASEYEALDPFAKNGESLKIDRRSRA